MAKGERLPEKYGCADPIRAASLHSVCVAGEVVCALAERHDVGAAGQGAG